MKSAVMFAAAPSLEALTDDLTSFVIFEKQEHAERWKEMYSFASEYKVFKVQITEVG